MEDLQLSESWNRVIWHNLGRGKSGNSQANTLELPSFCEGQVGNNSMKYLLLEVLELYKT